MVALRSGADILLASGLVLVSACAADADAANGGNTAASTTPPTTPAAGSIGVPSAGRTSTPPAAGTPAATGRAGSGSTATGSPTAGSGTVASAGSSASSSSAGSVAVSGGTSAPQPSAAGSAGATTAGAGGAASAAAGSGAPSEVAGAGPKLPEIKGECPEFKNGGTIMVAGHRSIVISAGEPGKGGPLLFYWHGTGGSAGEAMRTLPAAVRNEIIMSGGIIAAFNGNQSSGSGGDCSGTGAHNMADFDAADQIAACAVKNHGIDARRIYTTGCSAGGLQSGCMAMMRSSYLAAAAPNSGGIVARPMWQDMHSPAIFTMHGGSSDMVIVTFSQTSATLDMQAKSHGSFVVNCDHGGGHCQAPAALQTAAWQFMKDHPFGFDKSPWTAAIPSGVPNYCKIY